MPTASRTRFALEFLAVLALVGAVALLAVTYGGVYDITAVNQHTRPVHWALDTGMRQAVKMRSKKVVAPSLADPGLAERGFVLYRESCLQCHGAPGVAPEPFARGLMPLPNNLAQTALEWKPEELFWVTKNGLKMTAMPAWEYRYPDKDLWAIVAFLQQLPKLTVTDYAAMDRDARPAQAASWTGTGGDADRGAVALQQYACTTCHTIPGIVGANAQVGPPLAGMASRKYIAGRLPNTQENMVQWLREPKRVSPQTLMPHLDVTEPHARDIAAYLAKLH